MNENSEGKEIGSKTNDVFAVLGIIFVGFFLGWVVTGIFAWVNVSLTNYTELKNREIICSAKYRYCTDKNPSEKHQTLEMDWRD